MEAVGVEVVAIAAAVAAAPAAEAAIAEAAVEAAVVLPIPGTEVSDTQPHDNRLHPIPDRHRRPTRGRHRPPIPGQVRHPVRMVRQPRNHHDRRFSPADRAAINGPPVRMVLVPQ